MHYTYTFAASSPSVANPSTPLVRVPRYLRRYTICAAQHRPTSPLANSFTPDDYNYLTNSPEHTPSARPFSSSAHQLNWDRRRSEPFTVNPGPKLHHCSYTTIPSSSTSLLSRAQSLVAHVSTPPQQLQRRSSNSSIRSHSSVSSSATDCSFHTAPVDTEYHWQEHKTIQPTEDPSSWVDPLSIDQNGSDSSNSGSFGFTSKGGQSSADTVVSPDDNDRLSPEKENKPSYDDDEWPVTYLTTITRRELQEYEKDNNPQQKRRRFTWGRKESRKFLTDEGGDVAPTLESEMEIEVTRKKSRKLKKKPPEFVQLEDDPDTAFDPQIIRIYSQGEQEEFDPLKDLPTQEGPITDAVAVQFDELQVGIAISSDDILQAPFETAVLDEWEDMESTDHRGRKPSQDGSWTDDAMLDRIRSRTPQEILQGLDVVHEEEEEDSTCEVKVEDAIERDSYPDIQNKGKGRQDDEDFDTETPQEATIEQEVVDQPNEIVTQPVFIKPTTTTPRSRKLSKRRRSRRTLSSHSLAPPLPERSISKRQSRTTSKKPSVPTLQPRPPRRARARTPKTLLSTVFRPFNSLATFLGIDVTNSRKRLSRELRTPNVLLAGRHFSEKHIPRFPSRLDGLRTVDKKVAKYDE